MQMSCFGKVEGVFGKFYVHFLNVSFKLTRLFFTVFINIHKDMR